MHHTPPPAPLIIQGAHFEFHEPQILPTSETFIANPKERKQPEFYKFWVHKDGKNNFLMFHLERLNQILKNAKNCN